MKSESNNKNALVLKGYVTKEPECVKDSKYYEFELSIKRHSGAEDLIKVMFDSTEFDKETLCKLTVGAHIGLMGRMVAYFDNHKAKIRALATYFGDLNGLPEYVNDVYFEGYVSRNPNLRGTPLGKTILELMISTKYEDHVSYVPVIAWNNIANKIKGTKYNDFAMVSGRFQSRDYEKVMEDGSISILTAYEISAYKVYVGKE
jgi:hypothetical protein